MSVDTLQEKIRKLKNPTMLELYPALDQLPDSFASGIIGCTSHFRELLLSLKDVQDALAGWEVQ